MSKIFFLTVFVIQTLVSTSQSINNISTSQRQDGSGKVDVNYTLSGNENAYNISAEVSLDNGNTWQSITNLSGHVYNVSPGNRQLVWNAGTEMPGEYVSNARIKLTATEGGGGTGQPCPGIPTVYYEGQTYNTVFIGSKCWLRENLNVGYMISGDNNMTNNGFIEKYCYNNNEYLCGIYGGLYQWHETMQYDPYVGAQGICPDGWHIPSDDEWKLLEGTVDSQYGIGDPQWDNWGSRGFDAGYNLKFTSTWGGGGNGSDVYNFSTKAGGYRNINGGFSLRYNQATFWTSEVGNNNNTTYRDLWWSYNTVYRSNSDKQDGYSVRCIKDGESSCGTVLIDARDNKSYNTVKIGSQCWMQENLDIGTKINAGQNPSNNSIIEKYCYNNDDTNCDEYGGLYQWYEMMQYTEEEGAQGICPDGWHIPTHWEWQTLITYLGESDIAGGKMKEEGFSHWSQPNVGATNESEFTALPGGRYSFSEKSFAGYFWSSSLYSSNAAWARLLEYDHDNALSLGTVIGTWGFSVRCLQN